MKFLCHLFAQAVALMALSASATVYYAKPDGTGAGTSWDDAADLETALASAATEGGDVYAAKGLYKPAATLRVANGVNLYGGFAGADMSETPEGRDLAANVTLVSGDKNGDDTWVLHHPATGESEAIATPVVQDGALNIPAFADDYETVAPNTAKMSDNLPRLLSVAASATATVDGLVLVGGKGTNTKIDDATCQYGTGIFGGASSKVTVRNCRVVNCYGGASTVRAHTSCTLYFISSSIEHSTATGEGLFGTGSSALTYAYASRFVGNVLTSIGCVKTYNKGAIGGCRFERNYFKRTSAAANYEAVCIGVNTGDDGYTVTNCTFVANSVYDTTGSPTPVVNSPVRGSHLRFCSFVSNRTVVVTSAATVTAAGVFSSFNSYKSAKGCSFLWNTLSVSAPSATIAEAATVYGYRVDSTALQTLILDSCTFLDNAVTLDAPSATDPHFSRGVLMIPTTDANSQKMLGVYNSTFSGSTAGPDIVYGGPNVADIGCLAFNNVLWATGAAAKTPRVLNVGSGKVEVRNSIVVDTSLLADNITTSALVSDDPLIGKPTVYVAGYAPVCRLGALLTGLRTTYDIAYMGHVTVPGEYFCRAPGGSWYQPQNNAYAGKMPATSGALSSSALNETRPDRGSTIGAVQAIDPLAESGHTFVLRLDPARAGTVQNGLTQVCAADGSLSLTAVATNGTYKFSAWRTTDDTLVSEDNPLVISSPGAGTTVYKVAFAADSVDYSFDLGEHGTFTVSGTSVTNMTLKPGTTLEVPAYTAEDGYAVRSWTPELPSIVGSEPLDFVANYGVRESEVAPGEDLAAALEAAGGYPGRATVTLLAGTHQIGTAVAVPENVRLVGADGAVLTAPLLERMISESSLGVSTQTAIVEHVTFAKSGISTAFVRMNFVDCIFSNMTANGAVGAVTAQTNVTFRNCLFVSNNGAYYTSEEVCPCAFYDCTFRGNTGRVVVNSDRSAASFSNCLFKANVLSSGPVISTWQAPLTVRRCRFEDNVTSAYTLICCGKDAFGQSICDSLFLHNSVSATESAMLICGPSWWSNVSTEGMLLLAGCSFVSNTVTCTMGGSATNYCSILKMQNGCLPACVNCSFDRNALVANQTSGSGKIVSCIFPVTDVKYDTALCQCSFFENDVADGTIGVTATAAQTLSLFNCVFADADDAPAVAFADTAAASVKLYGCTMPALSDARAVCSSCNYAPCAFSSRYDEVDGRLVRRVPSLGAALNAAYPSYTSANGLRVVLDGETYRVALGTTTRSPTAPYETLPDMFGSVKRDRYPGAYRRYWKSSLRVVVR